MSASRPRGGFLSLFRAGSSRPALTRDNGPLAIGRRKASTNRQASDPASDAENRLIFAAQAGELAPVLEPLLPALAHSHRFELAEAVRLARESQMTVYDAVLAGVEIEGLQAEDLLAFLKRQKAIASADEHGATEPAEARVSITSTPSGSQAKSASRAASPPRPVKSGSQTTSAPQASTPGVSSLADLLAGQRSGPVDPADFGTATTTFTRKERREDI